MLIIGLTGGIGSGKSTVARLFVTLGAEIIDTDKLAREVVEPGTPALKKITAHFGKEILNKQQQLDRHKLRTIVFQHPKEKLWLEKLLHPLIRKKIRQLAKKSKADYCVIVIPLLVESKPNKLLNRVLVVDAPEDQQITRAKSRDNLSQREVKAIMKTQVTRKQRLAAADDVIHNDKDLNYLKKQVLKLHKHYLLLTAKTPRKKRIIKPQRRKERKD